MTIKRIGVCLLSIILLLSMLLCTVACDEKTPDEPNDTDNPSETELGTYTVRYNGTVIELGKDATAILKKLGEPTSKQFVASCGEGAGDQWQYTYSSIVLFTVKNGESETVDAVALRDDLAKTGKGITVGSTEAEVIAAYGEPTVQGQKRRYTEGSYTLELQLNDDGTVRAIEMRIDS